MAHRHASLPTSRPNDSPLRYCRSVRRSRNRVESSPDTRRRDVDAILDGGGRNRLVRRNWARCPRNCLLCPYP